MIYTNSTCKFAPIPTVRCPVSNKLYTDTARSDPFIVSGLEFDAEQFAAILNDLPDDFFEEGYL